jgi:hypothetical protein
VPREFIDEPGLDPPCFVKAVVKDLAYHLSSTLGTARTSAWSAPYKGTTSAIPMAPRHIWDNNNNIKMDLKEIGCEGMDWIQAQDRVQWLVLVNLRIP